jgi:hypothetical protein
LSLTNAQMLAVIASGGVVTYRDNVLRASADVPSDAQIAIDAQTDAASALLVHDGDAGYRYQPSQSQATALAYKGAIDCSANPNYPAANAGYVYIISVAGKIGGASGTAVEIGDLLICKLDGASAGTQAAVGASWNVIQANIVSTAGVPDSTNKRYVTDAQLVVVGNTSGTNTGDQSLPVKASGAELDTGVDDAKFATAKALVDSAYAKTTDITAAAVGLGSANNTADADKPVSTAQQTALNLKQTAGADSDGSTTNDGAAAGKVGEFLTASLAAGSATSLVTATPKTVIGLSLSAGDWDVWGVADYIPDGATTTSVIQQGISQTDNTFGAADTFSAASGGNLSGTVLGSLIAENTPHQRISLAVTTTIYLIVKAAFAISTMTAYGSIFARRRR